MCYVVRIPIWGGGGGGGGGWGRGTTFPGLSLQSLIQRTRGILGFFPVNRLSFFHVIELIYWLAICFGDHSKKEDQHQETTNKCRLKEEKE